MYTYQLRKGFFIALPIYNVIKKIKFNDTINESDMKRIKEVQELSTNVIIGKKVPLHNVQEEYVFINNTFYSESNFIQIVIHHYHNNNPLHYQCLHFLNNYHIYKIIFLRPII